MVHEYNTSASNQGIPSHEMHAVLGNLLDPSNPDPEELKGEEFWEFDIEVVGLGFHHFGRIESISLFLWISGDGRRNRGYDKMKDGGDGADFFL